MKYSPSLARLIEALRILPGVGPKSAQRMAFHLLERNREGARALASALSDAAARVGHCSRCRMLTDGDLCTICSAPQRDEGLLCVVESPADQLAIEEAGGFRGRYFVLHGHLSPLDGIGPEDIGLDQLEARVAEAGVEEVVLATNPTVEGEATAHYIAAQLSPTQQAPRVLMDWAECARWLETSPRFEVAGPLRRASHRARTRGSRSAPE